MPLGVLFGLAAASVSVGCQAITGPHTETVSKREVTAPGPNGRWPVQAPVLLQTGHTDAQSPVKPPSAASRDRPFPINLPTALQLANGRAIDIALAGERLRAAGAELDRANVLWLPTIYTGVAYFRHDGQQQTPQGDLIGSSRSSVTLGVGPSAVFAVTDAIFSPLAEQQVVRARAAGVQTATNDTLLAVAEAYFNVQQARGDLAGAEDAARRADDLVRKTKGLAEGLVLPVEVSRAEAEQARRRQLVSRARERWRTASADLVRLLRLDPSVLVEPLELPDLRVTLVPPGQSVDDLIPLALSNRPELAANQALVQATLVRVRQERVRPFVPSVLLRGASTAVPGTLAGGAFGGGRNGTVGDFGARFDLDLQVVWELQNLGFGNGARVRGRQAEHQASLLELLRVKDRVAADVAQAHAEVQSAAERAEEAEKGLKRALDSVEKNFEGLEQTRRVGNLLVLVIRPQEAVAAVQALGQAYTDYFAAAADYNRAQFRLYRALGHPAQALASRDEACPSAGTTCSSPQQPPPTGALTAR